VSLPVFQHAPSSETSRQSAAARQAREAGGEDRHPPSALLLFQLEVLFCPPMATMNEVYSHGNSAGGEAGERLESASPERRPVCHAAVCEARGAAFALSPRTCAARFVLFARHAARLLPPAGSERYAGALAGQRTATAALVCAVRSRQVQWQVCRRLPAMRAHVVVCVCMLSQQLGKVQASI